jgi:endoglucanase
MRFNFNKQITQLFLVLIILVLSITCINNDVMANTRYGRLTGVNWFGFETNNYFPHGLWVRDYKSVLQQVKDLGFNCIRLPWCNDMIGKPASGIQINATGVDPYTKATGLNLDLEGLDSLGVMDKIIDYAGTLGIYIILDNHSRAHDGYMNETLWYTTACPESKWISDWCMMVTRYKNKANVIGADLNNEPHGNLTTGMKPPATWGYDEAGYGVTDWKAAAERCGQEILKINPNLLIIVEGVENFKGANYWWGGNLKGVKEYPITGIPAGNLVYSPHEYGSGVYPQTWFSDPSFPNNLAAIWDDNFYFIKKQNIAPLLFGEFGIRDGDAANPSSTDYKWLTTLMAYMGKDCSWTFWCLNPNSGDTGGILQGDWVTVNTAKMNILKPYLAGSGPIITPVPTPVVTATPTPVRMATPVVTPTPTPVRTATPRRTPTPVRTATPVASITPSPVTPTPTPAVTATPVPVTGSIKVQFYNQSTAATSNQVYLNIKLVNTGSSAIALSNVKLRYYYTVDGSKPQTFYSDYSTVGSSNITGTFVAMDTVKTGADSYVEVGFGSGAGTLAGGGSVTIQGRFAKNDWTNYNQTNDYSFSSTGTGFADWTKITGYVSGALQWGLEP